MQLSTLAILLGLGIGLPQIWGLLRPEEFGKALRKFPRSEVWGYPLMLLATAWFVWNLKQENISDFAAWKPFMLVGFGAVGVLACVFVRDFLPVRGLAILLLLLAKVALDVQRWADTNWKNVITVLAYVWVVAGVVLTVSPWWLRDWFHWLTATENRVRIGCGLRLAFAVCLVVLGLTVYRADERRGGSSRLAIPAGLGDESHLCEQVLGHLTPPCRAVAASAAQAGEVDLGCGFAALGRSPLSGGAYG